MILGLLLVGCTSGPADIPQPRTLTVLAASSLSGAFVDIESDFEAEHPEADVVVSVAGSQTLATWIRNGIAADVFASADREHIEALAAEGLVGAPRPFARNELVLGVSDGIEGDPGLDRLPELGSLVLGDVEVPLGRYTEALLADAAGTRGQDWRTAVGARVVSREPSARMVAAKVALGEADAAIVYRTDALALDGVRAVPLPTDLPAPAYYQARVRSGPEPGLAQAWVDHVRSERGKRALAASGFDVGGP